MNLRNRLPFFLAYAQKPRKPIFLEYIEFDGNSYIDTGVIPSNNMEFETGVMLSVVQSTNLSVIASRDGEKRYQPIGVYQNKWSASIGAGYDANGSSVSANTKYDLRSVVSNGDSISLYSGNTLVSSLTSSGGVPANSLYLFARNYSSVDSYVSGRLYYCKIWDNGALIQDLRPALNPNGQVCMYDTVTKKYFYNAGTGELKAGGRFVDSIVFDGNSWIDTGITHQTCTVECGIKFANADTRQLIGFHSSNGGYWGCRNTSGRYEASGGLLNTTVSALDYNDVTIDFDCNDSAAPSIRVTVKDATASVVGTNVFTTRTYTIGALLTSNNAASYRMTGQVYYNKFYIGGELVQDLRPYVDSDGVACFKDVVTDTLFYNQDTGTLTYTEFEELEYLEFDGTQYIDTGYKPNSNSSVSCTYYPNYNSVFSCIFGTQNAATTGRFYAVISSTLYRLQLNSGDISVFYGVNPTELRLANNGSFASVQQKVSLTIDNYNKQIKVASDELTNTYDMTQYVYDGNNLGEVDCQYNLLIGDRSTAGVPTTSNGFKGQIFSFEIRENGVLVRDMIPAKRSDGISCMYDRVENKYYEPVNK